jgi:hypothetical protein
MVDNENKIRIYKYKDTNLHNIYYDLIKDEFYVKKSEKTNYFTQIRWKHVFRNYRNKKMILINKKHIAIYISTIQKLNKRKESLKKNG